MSKVHRMNENYPLKIEIVIGKKHHHRMYCISTMLCYPKGTAPLHKTLVQLSCLIDTNYLIANNLDIDYLLNDKVIPNDLLETDLTITAALEILKAKNAENA